MLLSRLVQKLLIGFSTLALLCCASTSHLLADAKWYNPASWFSKAPHSQTQPKKTAPEKQPSAPMAPLQETVNETKNGAKLTTEKGVIIIAFYEEEAPITVKNFKKLAGDKFYDAAGMKFHRVVEGFVIQTGDPTGTGYGGSSQTIPLEAKNKLSHDSIGVVAMARGPLPNSASSQFYITLDKHTSLDGKYAIFAEVIQGLDVVNAIKKDDKLYGVELINVAPLTRENRKKWGKE